MRYPICLHHDDLDGYCSAAVVVKALGSTVRCEPVSYGIPLPELRNEKLVVIVDFNPPADWLRKIVDNNDDVLWIDHHQTSVDLCEKDCFFGDIPGVRSEFLQGSRSAACELAWRWFFDDNSMYPEVPYAVKDASAFDTGRFSLLSTPHLFFHYSQRVMDISAHSEDWVNLLTEEGTTHYDNAIMLGRKVRVRANAENKRYEKQLIPCRIDDYSVSVLNSADKGSVFFREIHTSTDINAVTRFDGKKWCTSLYSNENGVNVRVLCEARGGGGHDSAAGFVSEELPFIVV